MCVYGSLGEGTGSEALAAKYGGIAGSRVVSTAGEKTSQEHSAVLLTHRLHPCPACGRLSQGPLRDWTRLLRDCPYDTDACRGSCVVNDERCSGVAGEPHEGRTWRVGRLPCRKCECHHHTAQIGKLHTQITHKITCMYIYIHKKFRSYCPEFTKSVIIHPSFYQF